MSWPGFMRFGWRGFQRLLPQHAEYVQYRATIAAQKALDKYPRIRTAADVTSSRITALKQAIARKWYESKWVKTSELRVKLGTQFKKSAAVPRPPAAPKPAPFTPTKASEARILSTATKIKSPGHSRSGRSK
jgi:hypothetical protein